MGAIDVGAGAADYETTGNVTQANLDLTNPANDSGTLTSFEVWVKVNSTTTKVGTFSGSSLTWDDRDYENLGAVTGGSKQTFTGKNCDVVTGDIIGGVNLTLGYFELSASGGSGLLYKNSFDPFGQDATLYTLIESARVALYATGFSPVDPTVTTQSASAVTSNSCTGNGNITDTGEVNATRRGFAYKIGTTGDPTIADSIVYDDGDFGTGAYTKTIALLKLGTHYRVAAYATNSLGTSSYGSTVEVFTPAENIFGWTT